MDRETLARDPLGSGAFGAYHGPPDPETVMPKIDIRRPHQLSLPDARAVVEQVAARMRDKFGMEGHWQGDSLRFSRAGVNGAITVGSDSIHVAAELGMMLAPLKGMLEQEIRRKLDEHFA
jgi:putative polyhydroxyalkanoate system protein